MKFSYMEGRPALQSAGSTGLGQVWLASFLLITTAERHRESTSVMIDSKSESVLGHSAIIALCIFAFFDIHSGQSLGCALLGVQAGTVVYAEAALTTNC